MVVVDTPVIAPAGLKVLGFDVKVCVEGGLWSFVFADGVCKATTRCFHLHHMCMVWQLSCVST